MKNSMTTDIKFKDLEGETGFLNGQKGLHEQERLLFELLHKMGKPVKMIDNLFEEAHRLKEIIVCDNLVMSTRGTYDTELTQLIKAFDKLYYAPKKVIFMGESTALYFCGIARELKAKHGTKFYFPDTFDWEDLEEIVWI